MSKVHVTVKSVETANRLMQQSDRSGDRVKLSGYWIIKPMTPSPAAIAKAGERALQSVKKQPLSGEVVSVSPPAPGHTAYSSMVQHENDMVGFIAYSLYKRDKIAFMAKHFEEIGRMPNEEEKMAFYRTSTLPGPVSAYRAQATYLMQQMYDDLLGVQVTEIEEKYHDKLVDDLKKAHPFMTGVWQHLIAGLLIWAVVGFVIAVLYGHKVGYKEIAKDFIADKPAATPAASAAKN